jgi:hypothetical protein
MARFAITAAKQLRRVHTISKSLPTKDNARLAKLSWQNLAKAPWPGTPAARGARRATCLLTALSLLAAVAHADGLGGLSGAFLRLPVSADAAARGGANTANPAYACSWWNPAAIVTKREKTLVAGGGYRSLGRTEGLAAFEFPIPPRAAMGLSALYRGDPFLDKLYTGGPYANPERAADKADYTSISFKLGLSYLVSRALSLGVNISAYYQRLPTGFAGDDFTEVEYSSATALGGFDLAARYKASRALVIGVAAKNLLGSFDWVTSDENLGVALTDILPPTLVLGSEYSASLARRPFLWTADLAIYALEDLSTSLDHVQATLNNGFEWRYWDSFHIRGGIRDILLNRNLLAAPGRYWSAFSFALTAGLRFDLSKLAEGLHGNYALSTDKVWAGVEQQLDIVYSF